MVPEAPRRPCDRRAPIRAVRLAGMLLISSPALAQPDVVEEIYVTRSVALREMFPGAARIESTLVELGAEERSRVESRLGMRLFEQGLEVFRGLHADGRLQGYAIITEEIGKYQPITFIVGVTPDARVKNVAVMVYRESHGGDVRRRRFLSQFVGKTTRDRIQQNRDIINISGATISVRSISRGVKKVLHCVDECLIGPHRRLDVSWRRASLDDGRPEEAGAGPIRRMNYAMGTTLEAVGYGDPAVVGPAIAAAFDEVGRLERLLSDHLEDSEISIVNREAAGRAVPVSAETIECVGVALAFATRSGGAFDPTLVRDGHRQVAVDANAGTIRFLRDGMRLDLGGIGKGYALDRAAAILEARGVTRALLNFGGQVLALDAPPGEKAWIVGVRDPGDEDRVAGCFELVRGSISTSAAYERGEHVIDPRSGKPAHAVLSATVCARRAVDADALSTALDVLGPEAGLPLATSVEGGAALVVPLAGGEAIHASAAGAPRLVRLPAPGSGAVPVTTVR